MTISSTTQFLPSRYNGLCFLERKAVSFNFVLGSEQYIITVLDRMFQNETIDGETVRTYIDNPETNRFTYSKDEINEFFSAYGINIVTSESFDEKLTENIQTVLLLQSQSVNWKGNSNYQID